LSDLGYKPGTNILLFRGVAGKWKEFERDQVCEWHGNSAESWSLDYESAEAFATSRSTGGVVIAVKMPVERILSIATTGLGCLPEKELVTLGDFGKSRVKVVEVFEPDERYI
jgi:hypothetical protein